MLILIRSTCTVPAFAGPSPAITATLAKPSQATVTPPRQSRPRPEAPQSRAASTPADPNNAPFTTSAFDNPWLWTGQRYDPAPQLYHFVYRTYSPRLGRWLQHDPLGYVDGVNLYEYVSGMPLGAVDPLGLDTAFGDEEIDATINRGGVVFRGPPTNWGTGTIQGCSSDSHRQRNDDTQHGAQAVMDTTDAIAKTILNPIGTMATGMEVANDRIARDFGRFHADGYTFWEAYGNAVAAEMARQVGIEGLADAVEKQDENGNHLSTGQQCFRGTLGGIQLVGTAVVFKLGLDELADLPTCPTRPAPVNCPPRPLPDPRPSVSPSTAATPTIQSSGPALARELGEAGEAAVGLAGRKTAIRIPGTMRTRYPDALNVEARVLTEVKNCKRLGYTRQLRDYSAWCEQNGYTMELWIRPSTRLYGPLQDAIDAGRIKIKYIQGSE